MDQPFALPTTKRSTKRPFVLGAILLGMFMVAIEGTIVATAMPSIVAELGGFARFSWVFSIFLLMQAVTIPIYGKLADLIGRKPVYTFGAALFLIGSALCGYAQSMTQLILYRFIQGIGAGAVQPIATTIVGDLYPLEERGKIQGYLSSVWGISSIIGPALGGVFVQYLSWSWVFWVNIPFGLLSVYGIWRYFHETVEKKKHPIDYRGAMWLVVWVSALMLILTEGGSRYPWVSVPIVSLSVLGVTGFIAFLRQEATSPEPMLPLDIWKNRFISVANTASLTTGIVMIGVSTFLPTFVQGVLAHSPTVAGFALSVMSIGWPLASTITGKLLVRIGFRLPTFIGALALIAGAVVLLTLTPNSSPVWAGVGSFAIGVGMGFTATTFIVAIQNLVTWEQRGVATASHLFMRTLGTTIGAALLGGVLNSRLHAYLTKQGETIELPLDFDVTHFLFNPGQRMQLPPEALEILQKGLYLSLHSVFWGILAVAVLTLIVIAFFPAQHR